ncbi:MAG: tRNA uridine-5-carboxymethylaminomethyl(34) synthesis GTPase MnmE, partial [Bacteroidales bacterium]|nr:tRNA uridine-5-carboxymethylaminomethyl(34) synthesis GTPase MnmE [Bacteroidales bacterium]
MKQDTICALATPSGGAIAIIRVSGPDAVAVADSIFSKSLEKAEGYTLHFGKVVDVEGKELDEVLVSVFRAPHSYTGEDSVEFSCHGSSYIIGKVMELLVRKGCRLARPGEFSMRAFLNGKMDLSQAEAVADLIAATNRATHQIAFSQLRGHFSGELSQLRQQLLELTSLLELELDFSDHEDLEFANRSQLLALARHIDERITTLASTFETGQAIKAGIPVAIVGKTNVGKSTLLNRLLHDERAIVSDIHGTTRDTIEDVINIRGVSFRFIDTAGIRQTADVIEQIGIDRTYQAISRSRIILWLVDEEPTLEEQKNIETRCQDKSLIIVSNKSDNGIMVADSSIVIPHSSLISISAKHGLGIETLEAAIYEAANLPDLKENDVIVTSTRHHEALVRAHEDLLRALDTLTHQLPGDLIAEDLHLVLSDLSEITGEAQIITSQETLNYIFRHHCV